MNILIANDDGFSAVGIKKLAARLAKGNDVLWLRLWARDRGRRIR